MCTLTLIAFQTPYLTYKELMGAIAVAVLTRHCLVKPFLWSIISDGGGGGGGLSGN